MGNQMCGAEENHDDKPITVMMKGPSAVIKDGDSLTNAPITLIDKVWMELNLMRQNPSEYARKITELYTSHIKGDYHSVSKQAFIEGAEAFKEVERVLALIPRLPKLEMEDGLRASAYEHVVFLSQSGTLDSVGRGGTNPLNRMERFGALQGTLHREVVAEFGHNDPALMVCELLADDGIIDRRNRMALLNPRLGVIGIALCKRGKEYVLVLDLAQGFSTDPAKCRLELLIKSDALSRK